MKKLNVNKLNNWRELTLQIAMLFFVASIFQACSSPSSEGESEAEKAPDISEMVSQLSLEEKVQLVVGTGMYFPMPDSVREKLPERFRETPDTTTTYGRMVSKIRTYLPGTAGVTSEYPGVGITSQTLADGPAGLRITPQRTGDDNTYYATAFPIGTLLASTWDTELVNQVGQAMGEEVLEYGADVLLAPALNIHRDPLCGRNFEYYSEDPLVSGKIAAAMVNGVQSNGVGTSIKHFAVNNSETNRTTVNTIVSERALREIYLKGFEIAVKEGQPWTVMSSYNKVNGTYTSEDPELLTTILRDEWGFDGYVMTDWGGGSDRIAQMKAGNDMIQPGNADQMQKIIDAVNSGELDQSVLDRNVERILSIMVKTPRFRGYEISNNPDLEQHAQVTRQAASEGMVLLENKEALPLSSDIKNVALFGTTSYDFVSGGSGSGDVNEAYTVSLLEGLKEAGYSTDSDLQQQYEAYIEEVRANRPPPSNIFEQFFRGKVPVPEMNLPASTIADMAAKSDVALITIGRNAGEGGDREPEAGDFYLTDVEKQLIKNVSEAFKAAGKKAVVVLNVPGVIETASWKNMPDAVLCAWLPGQEAGNSVVDVLSGKVNPSGKLTSTFPVMYNDTPSSSNFPGTASEEVDDDTENLPGFGRRIPWEIVYEEDIYVGYRYYTTFDVPVSYEFGYGLSYTNFEFSDITVDKTEFDGELTVSVTVTNTGDVAGKEVAQVYVSKPDGSLKKAAMELVAFDKTKLLNPGESETLTFSLDSKAIASYNPEATAWVVESGDYQLKIGSSSKNIAGDLSFSTPEDITVESVNKVMLPEQDIDLLTPGE